MKAFLQSLKSRTIRFGYAIAILSVLQGFVFQFPVPVWAQGLIGIGIALSIVYLRYLTTQPISEK